MPKATFAAGCFWGIEAMFRKIDGVSATVVGYTGGVLDNPTYEDVCSGETGHAEAVEIEFDQTKVSYAQLLDLFWSKHDPTTLNRQGPDVGTQYRSAVFFHDPQQEKTIHESIKKLEAEKRFRNHIVTEVLPASKFYRAENYHQQYYEKRGLATCRIKPKKT